MEWEGAEWPETGSEEKQGRVTLGLMDHSEAASLYSKGDRKLLDAVKRMDVGSQEQKREVQSGSLVMIHMDHGAYTGLDLAGMVRSH